MNHWSNLSINPWTNEAINRWFSESMNKWTDDSVKQWINDSMPEWFSGSMNQWSSESMKEWSGEAMNQCTSKDSVNQRSWTDELVKRFSESMESRNQWTNASELNDWVNERVRESMNHWFSVSMTMDQWTNERKNGWLFAEAPFLSATYSLSSHLFELLVLWAASQLALL